MKLQSMTDFVLKQKRPMPSTDLHEQDYYYEEHKILERIVNYAEFLKQPLKLEMFIPCDDEGNVLEEPKELDKYCKGEKCICGNDSDEERECSYLEYEKAIEKVLFEGWEKRILNPKAFKQHLGLFDSMEEVIVWDLTLTENATKQFL